MNASASVVTEHYDMLDLEVLNAVRKACFSRSDVSGASSHQNGSTHTLISPFEYLLAMFLSVKNVPG